LNDQQQPDDFWAFIRQQALWIVVPILVILAILFLILVILESDSILPFDYGVF